MLLLLVSQQGAQQLAHAGLLSAADCLLNLLCKLMENKKQIIDSQ